MRLLKRRGKQRSAKSSDSLEFARRLAALGTQGQMVSEPLSTKIAAASSPATTSTGRSTNNSLAAASPRSLVAPSNNSASPSSPRKLPRAKGRIERLWGALQDRLTSELRQAAAGDLDSANAVLQKFVADYNRRFARTPRDTQKASRPAPQNLERIRCFAHQRIVSNDNVVQGDGQRLQIHPQLRRFSFAGAKVQIYRALDGASRSTIAIRGCRIQILRDGEISTFPLFRVTFLCCYNSPFLRVGRMRGKERQRNVPAH